MTVLQVWREYSGTALLFKMKHDCNIYCYHLKKKREKINADLAEVFRAEHRLNC